MGIDENFSFYLVSIANAGSAVGRLSGGILADRYGMWQTSSCLGHALNESPGALNVMAPSTFVAGILTYVWPFLTSKSGYAAVGFFYGYVIAPSSPHAIDIIADVYRSARVSSGVFVSMLAAPLITMGETHDVGLRLGMFFTILALGALAGPPISGAINEATGGFKDVGYYAGMFHAFGA